MKYSIGFYLDRRDIAIKPGDLNYRTNETKQKKYEILKFLLDEINKLILANEREQSLYTLQLVIKKRLYGMSLI